MWTVFHYTLCLWTFVAEQQVAVVLYFLMPKCFPFLIFAEINL